MSGVVVAGAVTVVGYADHAGASLMLAGPLVLLGLVAVPSTGQELGSARRDEIAVARLRGLQGARLVRMLAVEPGLAVAAGGLAGLALGTVGVWLTTRSWLEHTSVWPGWRATAAAGVLVLATLAAVLLGMARAVREPLSEQVALAERPRAMTTAATFVSLLVVMAAAVATYRARVTGAHDPDWVVLLGPALVALASGQVAVWVLRLLTRLLVARSVSSGVPLYLAVRRLRGTAGMAGPVRLLVAATVLATLALAGAGRVSTWTEDTARLESGASTVVRFDQGATAVLQLTRTIDPQGNWLMAGVFVPGREGGAARRAFLDTERYDAVVGDRLDDSTGTSMADATTALRRGAQSGVTRARSWDLAMSIAGDRRGVELLHVAATLDYLNDAGVVASTTVRTTLGPAGLPRMHSIELRDCEVGCAATGLTFTERVVREPGGRPEPGDLPVLFTRIQLGEVDLVDQPWRVSDGQGGGAAVVQGGAGLTASPSQRDGQIALEPAPEPLPVLTTPGLGWPDEGRVVDTPGGVEREATVVGEVDAAPFVQADGVVADLARALTADLPTIPGAEVMVLAREGTPAAMLDALAAAGGSAPTPLAATRSELVARTGAGQARAFALMAVFCLGVAVLALAASAARLRASWRREVAALRLLGIPARQIRRAGAVETTLLAVAAVGTGVVGGVLAVRLLLGSLPVVRLPEHALALGTATPWWAVLVAAGVTVAALASVQRIARTGPGASTAPATLREGVAE
ncbi:MAG: FtsX-like permease family protein [Nocardioidaceae bacterium]